MRIGCIVGKFYPLHKGHIKLFESALKKVDKLYIFIYFNDGETIPINVRKKWVKESINILTKTIKKEVVIKIIIEQFGLGDTNYSFIKKIAEYLRKNYPNITHLIGANYKAMLISNMLGCDYISIKKNNLISSSKIASNFNENKEFLPKYVEKDYIFRVCFVGIESSGKTTLIRELGRELDIPYVEEYGRTYCEVNSPLDDGKDYFLTKKDFHNIAIGHNRLVLKSYEHALSKNKKIILVDTDHIITQCFYKRYLDKNGDKKIQSMIEFQKYDLFIWLPPIEFEDDGTRRIVDDSIREKQLIEVKDEFTKNGIELITLPIGLSVRERSIWVKNLILKKFKTLGDKKI